MGNNLVEKTEGGLPTSWARASQIYLRARRMMRGYGSESEEGSREIVAFLEEGSRPIKTKVEIATQLGMMLHGFPNGLNKVDPEYIQTLAQRVGLSQPTFGVLELACLNLVDQSRPFTVPFINDMLVALAEAARERRHMFAEIGNDRNYRQECSAEYMLPYESSIDDRL